MERERETYIFKNMIFFSLRFVHFWNFNARPFKIIQKYSFQATKLTKSSVLITMYLFSQNTPAPNSFFEEHYLKLFLYTLQQPHRSNCLSCCPHCPHPLCNSRVAILEQTHRSKPDVNVMTEVKTREQAGCHQCFIRNVSSCWLLSNQSADCRVQHNVSSLCSGRQAFL